MIEFEHSEGADLRGGHEKKDQLNEEVGEGEPDGNRPYWTARRLKSWRRPDEGSGGSRTE